MSLVIGMLLLLLLVMTLAAVRLLQELRRQLRHPSPLEEGVVDQPVTLSRKTPSVGARVRPLFHRERDATVSQKEADDLSQEELWCSDHGFVPLLRQDGDPAVRQRCVQSLSSRFVEG